MSTSIINTRFEVNEQNQSRVRRHREDADRQSSVEEHLLCVGRGMLNNEFFFLMSGNTSKWIKVEAS